jgi:hypothetical protein
LIAVSVVIATETAIKSAASSRMSEMSVLNNSPGGDKYIYIFGMLAMS